MLTSPPAPAGAAEPVVDTSDGMLLPAVAPSADVEQLPRAKALRERFVTPDTALIEKTLEAAAADRTRKVRLELFPDVVVEVPTLLFDRHADGFTWAGSGTGPDGSHQEVSLAYHRPGPEEAVRGAVESVTADIWTGAPVRLYQLRAAAGAVHALSEVDASTLVDGEDDVAAVGGSAPPVAAPPPSTSASSTAAADDIVRFVDVLVVHTPAARGASSMVEGWINSANMANAASGVPFRFRTVFVGEVAYTESGNLQTDLHNLTAGSIPNVLTWREQYNADLVSMIVASSNDGKCGRGEQPGAFGVAKLAPNCTISMVHEMGHNFGLHHDWAHDSSPGSAPYNWAHGFINPTGQFRTLMGIADLSVCGDGCARIAHWSDPNTTYNGLATGTAHDQPNPADNADALKNLWPTVEGFRTPPQNPVGAYDTLQQLAEGVRITGWAIDFDEPTTSLDVQVTDNGAYLGTYRADKPREDLPNYYPNAGTAHGIYEWLPLGEGYHNVCITALNVPSGPSTSLGCKSITVRIMPFGSFDWIRLVPGGVQVAGWAIDPETTGAITVKATVDGMQATSAQAGGYRPDLDQFGRGPNHGFIFDVPIATAENPTVCLTALNYGFGSDVSLGCRTVVVHHNPFGSFDIVGRAPTGAWVRGWAIDPDTANPISVRVYVDGSPVPVTTATAGDYRDDLGSIYPDWGPNHGYMFKVPLSSGREHNVCIDSVNVAAGSDQRLSCKSFYPGPSPYGYFDGVGRIDATTFYLVGWAIDPDTDAPIPVQVTVDGGPPVAVPANVDRSDVGNNNSWYGPKHGFDTFLPGLSGTHDVCVTAVNVPGGLPDAQGDPGSNTSLGCRTVPF